MQGQGKEMAFEKARARKRAMESAHAFLSKEQT